MFQLRNVLLSLPFISITAVAATLPNVSEHLPPLKGSYPVASSNLTIDQDNDPEDVKPYLDGQSNLFSADTYINDILTTEQGVLTFSVAVPQDTSTFGSFAGERVKMTGMVFYPTTSDNARADYAVPAKVFEDRDAVLQRMQLDDTTQHSEHTYPLVLFTHGFSAHPLYDFDFLQALASQGMVVMALFHGDLRFNDFKEMQSLRAYGIAEAVRQLKNSSWQALPDYSRTGVIGVSFGGSVALALAGAQLNDYQGLALSGELANLRAVIGMVPATTYRGGARWNFSGLKLNPLLIMAEKDESVELEPALQLIDAHADYTPDVAVLKDEGHFVSDEKWHIARQLVLLKLRSTLLNDTAASATLSRILVQREFQEIAIIRRAD